ncbi:MAG TPA: pentapeptide repeat-containing protein, partial [Candidatus Babeliaceae bacterium]|nr:pentapeptide repeat-containing protein [Candidatus Babeliaceae bacterium]
NLSRADLSRANLSGANLSEIKEDFFKRLLIAKAEVVGLYDYLIRGKIDGYFYAGECACFVGSIAKIRKEGVDELSIDLKPDSSSLTERWFLGINEGDTPQSNQVSAITAEWIREFAKEHSIKLPEYKLVSSFEFPQAFEGVKE